MEKHNASLKISIICVKVFTLAMIVIALFAPKIFSRLIEVRIAYLGGKLHCFYGAHIFCACLGRLYLPVFTNCLQIYKSVMFSQTKTPVF